MCHFITLIAPTDDAAAVDAVMRKHNRRGEPVDNASVAQQLKAGERQYLTTFGHCDCGTVLAKRKDLSDADFETRLAKDAERLRRKKWSATKIDRWVEDRRRALERPDGGGDDSISMWVSIITELKDTLNLPYAGLFIRFYDGEIATETFTAKRHEFPQPTPLQDQLAHIDPDTVTIFG